MAAPAQRMKIGIVGSGIASLSAAWSLSRTCDVTVFEMADAPGGHARTVTLDIAGQSTKVDVGVQVFTPEYYPTVMAYLTMFQGQGIEIPLRESPMTLFAAGKNGEAWGNTPEYQRMPEVAKLWTPARQAEATKFVLRTQYMTMEQDQEVIDDWLKANNVDQTFIDMCLTPIMSTVTLTSTGLTRVPFLFMTGIFPSMLSFFNATTWFRFVDGVESLLAPIIKPFADRIRLNTRVTGIWPASGGKGAVIASESGGKTTEDTFDAVIYGGSLGSATPILNNPNNPNWSTQSQLIGAFKNQLSSVVIHDDQSRVPAFAPRTASEIFDETADGGRAQHDNLNVIYNRPPTDGQYLWNTLYPGPVPLFPPGKIKMGFDWQHEYLDENSLGARVMLHKIQGLGDLWYCGGSASIPGFEQCAISGLIIAEKVAGATYPFDYSVAGAPPVYQAAYAGYQLIESMLMFPDVSAESKPKVKRFVP